MTVIAGFIDDQHRVAIASDSDTFGSGGSRTTLRCERKIRQVHPRVAVGGCGAYALVKLFRAGDLNLCPLSDRDDMREALEAFVGLGFERIQNAGHGELTDGVWNVNMGLLIATQDTEGPALWGVDGCGDVMLIADSPGGYHAEGSGAEVALGALWSLQAEDAASVAARLACEAAIAHSTFCGGPVQVITMPRAAAVEAAA